MAARGALAAAGALAVVALAASARPPGALAHGDASPNVRAVVLAGDLPAALRGMRVEVHRTVAPEIVLENATGRTVEVLDAAGVPFLRIGPNGVEGNLASPAWTATYAPGAPAPPVEAGDGPRWRRVRAEPAFGWFDPRLDASAVAVPHRVSDAGRPADVGRWRIPLRVDGEPVALAGRFCFDPPVAPPSVRLATPAEIAPGVRVKLLRGRAPGLLLESARPEPVVVLGERGEPFLRISPAGAEGNACSATFRASGRAPASPPAPATGCAAGEERWQKIASSPRIGWIEPRAALPGPPDVPAEGRAARPSPAKAARRWDVPVRIGDALVAVAGVTSPAIQAP